MGMGDPFVPAVCRWGVPRGEARGTGESPVAAGGSQKCSLSGLAEAAVLVWSSWSGTFLKPEGLRLAWENQ